MKRSLVEVVLVAGILVATALLFVVGAPSDEYVARLTEQSDCKEIGCGRLGAVD